jgi:hypothetical protein
MRNPVNALTDTIESLGLRTSVIDGVTPLGANHWILKILSLPNSLTRSSLIIEVIEEDDGDASVCVLQRKNVGRRVMTRILNRLCEKLDGDEDLISDRPSRRSPSPARRSSLQQ